MNPTLTAHAKSFDPVNLIIQPETYEDFLLEGGNPASGESSGVTTVSVARGGY